VLAARGQDDHARLGLTIELAQRVRQLLPEGARHGVELARAIEPELGHPVAVLDLEA
jgi:hypothetical protein